MTIPIEYSELSTDLVVASGSRYQNSRMIYYGEQRLLTLETYMRQIYELTGKESVMVITKGVEYRPDLVSYDYYGFPDNWWKIMEVNKLKDIMEFKAGLTIMLPSLGV